jgi:hypothetical protein
MPVELALDFAGLALYDIVLLADDSGSMAFEVGGPVGCKARSAAACMHHAWGLGLHVWGLGVLACMRACG